MIHQGRSSSIIVLILTESPFIDYIVVSCSFKQRGSDERFSHEPLQIRTVSKAVSRDEEVERLTPPMFTPLILSVP